MSVQTTRERYECGYCGGDYDDDEAVDDAYCSEECYYRDKGSGILDQIRRDHTICPTCYRTLKSVEKPPADVSVVIPPPDYEPDTGNASNVLIGYQYTTPNAEDVEHSTKVYEYGNRDTVVTAIGCQCGTGPGSDPDATLERVEGAAVVLNLLRELRRRYARGELDHEPSKARLFDALEAKGREWDYAVGAALWGDG